nr:MAG TPA: hypothetical protein [Caudoviricetes sp.]
MQLTIDHIYKIQQFTIIKKNKIYQMLIIDDCMSRHLLQSANVI